jgi:hypothetical protein
LQGFALSVKIDNLCQLHCFHRLGHKQLHLSRQGFSAYRRLACIG